LKKLRPVWILFPLILIGIGGGFLWFLAKEADLELVQQQPVERVKTVRQPLPEDSIRKEEIIVEASKEEPIEWPEGTVRNELVFDFQRRSELEAFLRDAKRAGIRDIEVIPALNLVRVRVSDDAEARLAKNLSGNAGVSFNPVVASPEVPAPDGVAASYLPFGDQALPWIGVPDDNSDWGEGIRIAVLDTGVADHPSLAGASIERISVLENPGGKENIGTHGAAVAALLVGQGDVRGIVPSAELLSVQVLNGDGVGDGFQLAKGIMAAVDGGADIINLSLGTTSESLFLWDAVQYAMQRDVTLVAAGGNEGEGQLMYPAAYPGVVAVGSIDGNGQQVSFSNRGEGLSVMAPGLGLLTAGPDGSIVSMNGTSFSAPIASGSLAYLQQSVRPGEAVRILQDYANDAGQPGHDGVYGHGIIDVERAEWRDVPGIYDIAVADHVLELNNGKPQMLITVENRGTAPAGNIFLEVIAGDRVQTFPIQKLSAGEVGSETISLGDLLRDRNEVEIFSRVYSPGLEDIRPDNDIRRGRIRLQPREDR